MQCAIRSSLRAMAIRPVAVQPHNGHALLSRIACLNGVNRVHMRCMSALPMIDTDASAVESKLSKESSPVIQIKGRNARKEYTLSRMESVFSSSNMVAVLQHNSLNVAEFADLRAELEAKNMKMTLFPNNLTRVALKGTSLEQLSPLFHNSSVVVYSSEAPIQVLSDIVKKHSKLHLLGVHVDGLILDMDMVKKYVSLPSMEQLYGELLSVINHPPRMLAAILQRGSSDLVQNIQRYIEDQKEGTDEATEQ